MKRIKISIIAQSSLNIAAFLGIPDKTHMNGLNQIDVLIYI